jgi:hypothetical protein
LTLLFIFTNIKPFHKSIFMEYPSVVTGHRFVEVEKDAETGDILIWAGRFHAVVSPAYGQQGT